MTTTTNSAHLKKDARKGQHLHVSGWVWARWTTEKEIDQGSCCEEAVAVDRRHGLVGNGLPGKIQGHVPNLVRKESKDGDDNSIQNNNPQEIVEEVIQWSDKP